MQQTIQIPARDKVNDSVHCDSTYSPLHTEANTRMTAYFQLVPHLTRFHLKERELYSKSLLLFPGDL